MERTFFSDKYEKRVIYTGYHDYHDHKGEYLNAPVGKMPKYRIGVELETVFGSRTDRSEFCANFKSNIIFMESDCSLPSSGCEFISIPLRPKDACDESFWMPFIRLLSREGVRSWGYGETGMHIHISRSVFPDMNAIGRLLYLYNYIIDPSMRTRVFGRGHGEWAHQMGETQKAKATKLLPEALKLKEVKDAVCKELMDAAGSRSLQINLTNRETIEFRQGKGSISAGRIAAVCNFVVLLCEYVNKYTDMATYTAKSFLDFVDEKGVGSLISYIHQEA